MKNLRNTFIAGIITMILTVIHHGYGAMIYDAPFRLHVALIAVPVILVLLVTYRIYTRHKHKTYYIIAFWLFIVVSVVFPVGIIGLFEGVYNHLLKNILFFGGASNELLIQIFPPPEYEMPENALFEVTGILQALSGLCAMYYLVKIRSKELMVAKPQDRIK